MVKHGKIVENCGKYDLPMVLQCVCRGIVMEKYGAPTLG